MSETVTISKKEYDSLIKRVDWLECLEAAGVDNWEGYDYARELSGDIDDEEEDE